MLVAPHKMKDIRAFKVEKLMTLRDNSVKIPQTRMEKSPGVITVAPYFIGQKIVHIMKNESLHTKMRSECSFMQKKFYKCSLVQL